MAQYAVPDGDITTSVWTTTPLWSKVEEGAPGDDTRVVSDANPSVTEAFVVSLSSVTDPSSSSGHVIRAKWRNELTGVSDIEFWCELRQGYTDEISQGTLIGTLNVVVTTEQTDQTDTYTLTSGEADSITDYTDLFLRTACQKSGGGGNPQGGVDFIELEVPDAVVGNEYTWDISGSFASNGALEFLLSTDRAVGVFAPSGNVGVLVAANPLGIVGPGGAVIKETATSKTGTVSFSGALAGVRLFYQAIAGVIGPSGTLSVEVGKLVAGVIAPAGAVIKDIFAPLAGIVGPGGAVVKETATSKLGTLSFSGALAGLKSFSQALAGAIGPSGALSVEVGKVLTGVFGPSGDVSKLVGKVLSGVLGFTGDLVGSLGLITQAIGGVIGPSGAITKGIGKLAAGAASMDGAALKETATQKLGSISPAGALSGIRTILRTLSGAIGPAGSMNVLVGKGLTGLVAIAGAAGKGLSTALGGVLSFGGSVSGVTVSLVTAVVNLTLTTRSLVVSLVGRTIDLTLKDWSD